MIWHKNGTDDMTQWTACQAPSACSCNADNTGRSIKAGSWVDRPDGTWALRITRDDIPTTSTPGRVIRQSGERDHEVEDRFRVGHPNCTYVNLFVGGQLSEALCTTPGNHR